MSIDHKKYDVVRNAAMFHTSKKRGGFLLTMFFFFFGLLQIVVGAGFSGLVAANTVHSNGFKVICFLFGYVLRVVMSPGSMPLLFFILFYHFIIIIIIIIIY